MPSRVIAFLIAFVLIWSGFSSIEAPRVLAQPSTGHQQAIVHGGGPAAGDEGSVEHHHLDDLPSQAQLDPPTDTPGPLPVPSRAISRSAERQLPCARATPEAGPPFLSGPLRPPCSETFSG